VNALEISTVDEFATLRYSTVRTHLHCISCALLDGRLDLQDWLKISDVRKQWTVRDTNVATLCGMVRLDCTRYAHFSLTRLCIRRPCVITCANLRSAFFTCAMCHWILPAYGQPFSRAHFCCVCMLVWAQASGLDPERWAHLHAIKLLVLQVAVVIVWEYAIQDAEAVPWT
jgi:hypothetical protein